MRRTSPNTARAPQRPLVPAVLGRLDAVPPPPARQGSFGASMQLAWQTCLGLLNPSHLPAHVRARKKRRERELEVLADAREEFVIAVRDIWADDASAVRAQVHAARSMQELWHLRVTIFGLVSCHHSQDEARERLAQLNRHFPTRSAGSGFTPLDGVR